MVIRRATIDDFNSVLELQLQLEDAECVFDNNLVKHFYSTERGLEKLKKRFENEDVVILVAEEDNRIIGFMDGSIPTNEPWYIEPIAHIGHICVDKDNRRRGIATELLDTFIDIAKSRNFKSVRLNAFPKNEPAISFYTKKGFDVYVFCYSKDLK